MLTLIDEHTRECLAIDVSRKLKSGDVLERLGERFVRRGIPGYIRSDNGPEFTAKAVRQWLSRVCVKTLFIQPGSPRDNGYCENFKVSSEMNCWLGSNSPRCWKPRCSSSVGEG